MRNLADLDRRPVLVALAGPNGAGKTTFYHAHLRSSGLRFVNPDVLAYELNLSPYAAARVAEALRHALVKRRESFVFETVFSDPAGRKPAFLRDCADSGYTVVLCYIGLARPRLSEERVAMRVSQGGHDVPGAKLRSRYLRSLRNLTIALRTLPRVLVFDNTDLRRPFRKMADFSQGSPEFLAKPVPAWFRRLLGR